MADRRREGRISSSRSGRNKSSGLSRNADGGREVRGDPNEVSIDRGAKAGGWAGFVSGYSHFTPLPVMADKDVEQSIANPAQAGLLRGLFGQLHQG